MTAMTDIKLLKLPPARRLVSERLISQMTRMQLSHLPYCLFDPLWKGQTKRDGTVVDAVMLIIIWNSRTVSNMKVEDFSNYVHIQT